MATKAAPKTPTKTKPAPAPRRIGDWIVRQHPKSKRVAASCKVGPASYTIQFDPLNEKGVEAAEKLFKLVKSITVTLATP